jgi:hypothetical protein
MRPYNIYIFLLGSLSLIYLSNCKREYNPPALQYNLRLLVVDGLLTNAPDSTFITLTRSRNVADSTPSDVESGANLTVEAENTVSIPFGRNQTRSVRRNSYYEQLSKIPACNPNIRSSEPLFRFYSFQNYT